MGRQTRVRSMAAWTRLVFVKGREGTGVQGVIGGWGNVTDGAARGGLVSERTWSGAAAGLGQDGGQPATPVGMMMLLTGEFRKVAWDEKTCGGGIVRSRICPATVLLPQQLPKCCCSAFRTRMFNGKCSHSALL